MKGGSLAQEKMSDPDVHIGIEMSDSHTTFSVVRNGSAPTLVHVDRRILPPGVVKDGAVTAQNVLVSALAPLVQECARYARARVSFSIPTARIASHVFTFPADFSTQNIDDALKSQIDEYFPYDDDDCVLWRRAVQATEQTLTMFVCATSRRFIRAWMRTFAEAGMPIHFFDIEPVNILRSVMTHLPKQSSAAVIDIGRRMTYISIIDTHGIRELKVLACPVQQYIDGLTTLSLEKIIQPVVHETSALLNIMTELYNLKIDSVLVCGKGSRDDRIVQGIEKALDHEVVRYRQLTLKIDQGIQRVFMDGLPFEYANSVGVALGAISNPEFAPRA